MIKVIVLEVTNALYEDMMDYKMYIQEGVARPVETLQENTERVILNYNYYLRGVYEPSRANPLLTADDYHTA